MAFAPTTDQLLDLDGVRRRADDFRFDLLDNADQTIGVIHPDASRPPTITNDTGATIPRTLTGLNLTAAETSDINTLSDRVRPVMVLQNGAEFSLGVFLWSNDNQPERAWGPDRASTLSDKMVLLNQGIRASVGWGKGADIGLAVLSVALDKLTPDEMIVDAINAELGAGLTFPLGTASRSILAQYMALVGFLPPFIDSGGRLNLVDTPDMDTVDPTLIYEAGGRIIDDSISRSNDLLDAPNVFRAYENSGQVQLVGEYRIPASAPHSVENRGFEICDPQPVSGLTTQAQANKAAKALSITQNVTYAWTALNGTMDPRHDTWDPATVLGDTVMETRWSAVLRSGEPHVHVFRRVF